MGKRQIFSAEEFQIIYVDILPLRRSITLYSISVSYGDFKEYSVERGEKSITF